MIVLQILSNVNSNYYVIHSLAKVTIYPCYQHT